LNAPGIQVVVDVSIDRVASRKQSTCFIDRRVPGEICQVTDRLSIEDAPIGAIPTILEKTRSLEVGIITAISL
jgi:hypothetical protein